MKIELCTTVFMECSELILFPDRKDRSRWNPSWIESHKEYEKIWIWTGNKIMESDRNPKHGRWGQGSKEKGKSAGQENSRSTESLPRTGGRVQREEALLKEWEIETRSGNEKERKKEKSKTKAETRTKGKGKTDVQTKANMKENEDEDEYAQRWRLRWWRRWIWGRERRRRWRREGEREAKKDRSWNEEVKGNGQWSEQGQENDPAKGKMTTVRNRSRKINESCYMERTRGTRRGQGRH